MTSPLPANNSGRKLRLGKRHTPAKVTVASDTSNTFVPLATNFDFLEGAFTQAQSTRRTLTAVTLATTAVMCSLALLGLGANSKAADADTATAAAEQQGSVVLGQMNKLDQAGGISAVKLREHAKARQDIYSAAVTSELDTANLISRLRDSTPSGVTLTNVDITNGSGDAAQAPTTATTAPTTPSANASPAPAGAPQAGVTLTATAKSYAAISHWSAALGRVPGLTLNGEPAWNGSSDALQVTLTGALSDAANTPRAKELATLDEYGLPTTATETD